jgi:hypothetical protein
LAAAALLGEQTQVAPAIPTVELAAGAVEPFRTERLVKPVRRVGRFAELFGIEFP